MNPRDELEKRYPLADFFVYFRHLSACQTVKALDTHEHHICPRKQFPQYAEGFPENLITLKIDDHAFAHRLLEAASGIKAPSIALFEKSLAGAASGGQVSAVAMNASLTFQKRSAMSAASWARRTPEQKAKQQKKAGSAGGKKSWNILTEKEKNSRLSHWKSQTTEQLAEAGRKGVHVRMHTNKGVSTLHCIFCVSQSAETVGAVA